MEPKVPARSGFRMKATIVIPTIRENCIKEFLKAWKGEFKGHRVIVIEDNPKKTFKVRGCEHYAWEDIESELGKNSWVIPRRTSGIRCFGFLKALEKKTDMVVTLDDDCFPADSFLKGHYYNLSELLLTDRWFSTDRNGGHLRGIPYLNKKSSVRAIISVGTWTNIPDKDAVHQLMGDTKFSTFNGIIPLGYYFPFCSMNFAFLPEYATLVYQSLNGQSPTGKKYPYNRTDDIWGGIISKKVCDHLNLRVFCGHPQVEHRRASNPFANLRNEAPGFELNEVFWQYIDRVRLKSSTPHDCYMEISEYLIKNPLPENQWFWGELGKALKLWVSEVEKRI